MSTLELAKEYITSQRYQILDEDSSDLHIAFRYQMNTVHFWGDLEDEHFFFISLPNFTDVTEKNMAQVKENCNQINQEIKLVKLYVLNDLIVAAAEAFYLDENDFKFQMRNALKHLVAAKVIFQKRDA